MQGGSDKSNNEIESSNIFRVQTVGNLHKKISNLGKSFFNVDLQESLDNTITNNETLGELEEALWKTVIAYQNYPFYTATGLPFSYMVKRGKNDEYTGELVVSRKSESKTLARSSIMLAFHRILLAMDFAEKQGLEEDNEVDMIPHEYKGPKAIGQIFGISYVYSMFWRWKIIAVPEKVEKKLIGV
jgi:hypothetical protein